MTEPSGWRSRRFGPLPRHASAYAAAVGLAAVVAAAASVVGTAPTRTEWTSFALLLPLAALAPRFRVAVGRNHRFHTGPAFIVAGALVLPPALVVGLVLALHLPLWSRADQPPWYIQVLQPLELHAQRARCLGRRRCSRSRRRRHVRAGRTACRRGLRRRQPHAARDHAAARPRAHVPRERPLLRDRARNRVRARVARRGRRRLHRVQPLAPAGPDRTARARPPLALDRRAAARERGAVPDDVRVRSDRDDAARRRRLDHGGESLARSATRLHRG